MKSTWKSVLQSVVGAGALALASAFAAAPAHADVGVSIGFSQPGVHGRIDLGRFPHPEVYGGSPIIVTRPIGVRPPPAYLWVPTLHRQQWRNYCGRYGACGVPVHFVRDDWYGRHVQPHAHWRNDRRDDWRDDRRDDRRDRREDVRDFRDARREWRDDRRDWRNDRREWREARREWRDDRRDWRDDRRDRRD